MDAKARMMAQMMVDARKGGKARGLKAAAAKAKGKKKGKGKGKAVPVDVPMQGAPPDWYRTQAAKIAMVASIRDALKAVKK